MGRQSPVSVSTLLALILSLLPLFILGSDVSRARERQMQEMQRSWAAETKMVGERLREVTTPLFWIEAVGHRFRGLVERSVAGRDGTVSDLQAELKPALTRAFDQILGPSGKTGRTCFDEPLLWAAPVGPLTKGNSVSLFTGPGFQEKYKSVFTELLREVGAGSDDRIDVARAETRAKRLRTILGGGISTQLFLQGVAGRPFPVIFQERQGVAVWNIVRRRVTGGTIPVAAFLLLVPYASDPRLADPSNAVLAATVRHWRGLLGARSDPRWWPAFLPLPRTFAAGQAVTIHPVIRRTGARKLLRTLLGEFSFQPPGARQHPPSVNLLTGYIGKVAASDGWWATVCPISPLTGRLGILLSKEPRRPILSEELVFQFALWIILTGWTAFLMLWWNRGSPPQWGVQGTLVLWFLGLAATPLALVIGSGERLTADLRSNMRDSVDRTLQQVGRQIDSGSIAVDQECWRAARSIARDPQLGRLLPRLVAEPQLARETVDACWRRSRRLGIDPILIVLTNGAGLVQSRSLRTMDAGVIDTTVRLYQAMARDWLTGSPGSPQVATSPSASGLEDPSGQASATVGTTVTGRTDFSTINANSLSDAGGISTFNYAGKQTVRFFDVIKGRDGKAALLFIVWNPETAARRYLKKAVHQAFLRNRDCYLAAFKVDGIRLQPIEQAGDSDGVRRLLRDTRSWGIIAETTGHRRFAFAGSRLPGYLWVVGASTDAITTFVSGEARWMTASALILLLQILAGAALLARWLAGSITRMTKGLERVAGGDLSPAALGEGRADELGEAGVVLDRMTGWLAERRIMSRFVAPQVLSAVEASDSSAEKPGRVVEAVTLVSDIRGFTSLSESHPPEAVFSMINSHIERMTRVIQRNGGSIDRFIGDAIQAVFYGDAHPDSATEPTAGMREAMIAHALTAARDMCREQRLLVAEREKAGLFGYEFGIGLDLGNIVIGVIGDPSVRLDHSALGEPMQRAAELESLSRHIREHPIVCTSALRERAGGAFRFAAFSEVTGRASEAWVLLDELEPALPGNRNPGVPGDGSPVEGTAGDQGPCTEPNNGLEPPRRESRGILAHPDTPLPGQSPAASAPFTRPVGRPAFFSWNWTGVLGFALILWLMPLLVIRLAASRNDADIDARALQEINVGLSDDWARCERLLDSTMPLRTRVRRWATALAAKASKSADPHHTFASALDTTWGKMAHRFPAVSFGFLSWLPGPSGQEHLRFSSGGLRKTRDLPVSSPEAEGILLEKDGALGVFNDVWSRGDSLSPAKFLLFRTRNQVRSAWGRFSRLPTPGKEIYHLWLPLHLSPQAKADRWSKPDGVFSLTLPGEALPQSLGFGLLGRQLSEHGCAAAFLPGVGENASAPVWIHQAFTRVPQLAALLRRGKDGFYKTASGSGWQVIVRRSLFGIPGRYVLARPWHPVVMGREDRLTKEPFDERSQIHRLMRAWTVSWLVFGVVFVVFISSGSFHLRIPLRWQMCGAFLVVLLPALVLTFLMFERSFGARRMQLESSQRALLTETIESADASRQIFLAWSCGNVERVLRKPGLVPALAKIEEMPDRERASASARLMDWFLGTLGRQGIHMGTPVFSGSEEFFVEVPFARKRANDATIYDILRRYTSESLRQLGRTAPQREKGRAGKKGQLVMGLFIDDTRNILLGLMSPWEFAKITVAPRFLDELTNFGKPLWLYFSHIGLPNGVRFCFEMSIVTPWLDALWSVTNSQFLGDPETDEPVLGLSPKFLLGAEFLHPSQLLIPNRALGGSDPVPNLAIQSSSMMELCDLAAGGTSPLVERVGRGTGERLIQASPGRFMNDSILFASTPIGRLLAGTYADLADMRLLLLGLLVFSVVLALQVAATFLEPIAALVEAAREIMAGNVAARLPVFAGVEFAVLARAFNTMAAGVETGRRLSRFVSGSVRDAARDADLHKSAMAGELRSAAILFTGITGFSNLVRSVPAPSLIAMANRHLRHLSSIVRAHGGDIDKFIGDKILAVFTVTPERGPAEAVEAAVAAASEMQRSVVSGESWQKPFGVGIVYGEVLAGIMGTSDVRLEFTVIGDTVNLASRLCDVAMRLDPDGRLASGPVATGGTVIDETAWEALPSNQNWRKLDLPPIKGKSRTVSARWKAPPGR